LNAVGSKIYSTAQFGDITITTNGATHSVSAKPWTGAAAPKSIEPKPQPKLEPEPKPNPKPDLGSGLSVIPGAPTSFQNCTAMRKHYLLQN
jgi:competence protein ComEC